MWRATAGLKIDQPHPLAIGGDGEIACGETNHGDKDVHTPKAHDHAAHSAPPKEFQWEKRNVHGKVYHGERKRALSAGATDSDARRFGLGCREPRPEGVASWLLTSTRGSD